MDPGLLPPPPERDPRTGLSTSARWWFSSPTYLLTLLAALLLLGAAGERSIVLATIAVGLLVAVWGVPGLWRRWRARRSDAEEQRRSRGSADGVGGP